MREFLKLYIYYPIVDFYNKYSSRVKRSFDYAVFGWTNHDFDYAYMYEIIHFKLKRIQKTLVNDKHHVHRKSTWKSLNDAIDILDRLNKDYYEEEYYKIYDKKWGKPVLKSQIVTLANGAKMRSSTFTRSKVKTEEDGKQSRKEAMTLYKKAERDRTRDLNRLNEILQKYSRNWWC